MPKVQELAELYKRWAASPSSEERAAIWHEMLHIHAEQQYVIGIVAGVPQPVVARDKLVNVPREGFYNWDPGAFFGIYRPETFWFR